MIKVEDGKYRVGNTKVLILVRVSDTVHLIHLWMFFLILLFIVKVLRNHVMVRVGGGWDTLGHYLERHDPCRSRSGEYTFFKDN